jgi:hypothetical protein
MKICDADKRWPQKQNEIFIEYLGYKKEYISFLVAN